MNKWIFTKMLMWYKPFLRRPLVLPYVLAATVFIISLLQCTTSNAQIITTYAGTGTLGYSGDGSLAVAAEVAPWGVACDASGNVYIADASANVIRKVNASGIISTIAGTGVGGYSGDGGPATAAQLSSPLGLACDTSGNLYIADSYNDCIRKVDVSGIISTIAGTGANGYTGDSGIATAATLSQPQAVAVDAAGNIYIADYYNNVIRKVNTSGIITTVAGSGNVGFLGDGGPATAAKMNKTTGVAVDTSGNIYISDYYNHRIRKVDASGIITTLVGDDNPGSGGDGGPANEAELYYPYGLNVDAAGNLYICDGSEVRKVNTGDTINTVAGNGQNGYNGDGIPATTAKLWGAIAVATDGTGAFYIADQTNYRLRKVYTPPACTGTPVAGSFTASVTMGCIPYSSVLTAVSPLYNPGITYQWQSSLDGTTWTNISNATDNNCTVSVPSSTYFRFYVTCTNSNTSDTSAATELMLVEEAVDFAALPYFQGFENWTGNCFNYDRPDTHWLNNPTSGNSSWRRNDQAWDANWQDSTLSGYSPTSTEGTHSARYHSYDVDNVPGDLNLYLNLSTPGMKQISFDYYNQGPSTTLTVFLSTDSGNSFTQLAQYGQNSSWTQATLLTTSNSPHAVLRFEGNTEWYSPPDLGIDSVNVVVLPPCTGTPDAGIASASPDSACNFTFDTLKLTGYQAATGLSFQWQSSPDSASWTDMVGDTSTTAPFTGQINTTYYRCVVTCVASSSTSYSNGIMVPETICSYCIPPTDNGCQYGDYFTYFITTGGIVNFSDSTGCPSTAPGSGYFFENTDTVSAAQGATVNFAFQNDPNGYPDRYEVWIDWNQDYTFEQSENVFDSVLNSGDTINLPITVPASALTGATRIRISEGEDMFGNTSSYSNDPCGDIYYGISKDYIFVVSVAQCTGTPSAGIIVNSDSNFFCASGSDTLTLFGATTASAASGIVYQWKSSTDGINYTNAGTGGFFATGNIGTTTYYKAIVTCIGSGLSDTTAADTVTINPIVAPGVTVLANPGTSITAGQADTFTATVTNGGNAPTYQWQNDGVNIPGATSQQYITTSLANNDVITCIVHSNAICASPDSAASNQLLMHVTPSNGVPSVTTNSDEIRIYPNPNNGTFVINGRITDSKEAKIEVLNVIGQVVYSTTTSLTNNAINKQVQLSNADADGIYLLRITTDNGSSVIRFVMER